MQTNFSTSTERWQVIRHPLLKQGVISMHTAQDSLPKELISEL